MAIITLSKAREGSVPFRTLKGVQYGSFSIGRHLEDSPLARGVIQQCRSVEIAIRCLHQSGPDIKAFRTSEVVQRCKCAIKPQTESHSSTCAIELPVGALNKTAYWKTAI